MKNELDVSKIQELLDACNKKPKANNSSTILGFQSEIQEAEYDPSVPLIDSDSGYVYNPLDPVYNPSNHNLSDHYNNTGSGLYGSLGNSESTYLKNAKAYNEVRNTF